ncbi:MAG: FeoB-associated Cys-rich membrane protein [Clostridia bacterium]|nr:FeoB-associated Cys-rich membrane protein [Clostridia bacterium]
MLMFLQYNLATILIAALLVCVVALVIWKIVKDKRSGASCNCGCGCKECPSASICHKER